MSQSGPVEVQVVIPFPTISNGVHHHPRSRNQESSASQKTVIGSEKPVPDGVYYSPRSQMEALPQLSHGHGAQPNISALRSSHTPLRSHANTPQLHAIRGSLHHAQRAGSAQPHPQQPNHESHPQPRPKVPQLQISTYNARPNAPNPSSAVPPSTPSGVTSAQPPARQQSFHPEVIQTAAAALLPAQSLFENAWKVTVHRVQAEFTQFHASLTHKIDAEKAAHANTLDACTRLRHELEDARYERGLVNGERERLSAELIKIAKENRILRAQLESVNGALKDSKGRCDLLAAENEIWKKGWAVAKTVTPRLQDMYGGGKTDDPSRQNNGELLQQIREQVDRELQVRISKILDGVRLGQERQGIQGENGISGRKSNHHTSTHDSPNRSPSNDRQSPGSHSETSTAVGTPALGSPALRLETRKYEGARSASSSPEIIGAKLRAHSTPSSSPCSFIVSPGLQNMMGSLDLERRRPANLQAADDHGVKSDSGEMMRPLKRRRADVGEQESDLGEQQSENATCPGRGDKNASALKSSAQISETQTKGDDEHCAAKKGVINNAGLEVEDSVDDMQLESDSDAATVPPQLQLEAGDSARSGIPSPSTPTKRALPSRGKIGIKHIDLLYEKQVQRLVCRMCLTRRKKTGAAVTMFALDASWPHLIGHFEREHPAARSVLERMSPAQVVEMRQRVLRGEVVPW